MKIAYTAWLRIIINATTPVIRNTDAMITAACTFSFLSEV